MWFIDPGVSRKVIEGQSTKLSTDMYSGRVLGQVKKINFNRESWFLNQYPHLSVFLD
jgi:hypothetical protein